MAKKKPIANAAPVAAPTAAPQPPAPPAPPAPVAVAPAPPAPVAPAPPAAPAPVAAPAAPPAAPAPAKAVRAKEPTQNGLTRPAPGSLTRAVWDLADSLTAAKGAPATRKEVVDASVASGTNSSTATTQFGRWCKFSGYVEKRAPKAPAQAPAVPAAPGAPAAPAPVAAAPEPAPATDPAYPAGYIEGYNGYRAAVGGATVANPYTAGTLEADGFTQGWTDAYNQHQAGTLVLA